MENTTRIVYVTCLLLKIFPSDPNIIFGPIFGGQVSLLGSTCFFYLRKLRLITLAAGIVAVGMAIENIKDFVAFKREISLTISDGNKQVLFKKMRSLVISSRFPAMIAGAAALAVGANCYELLCTAGFPMVYTKILTLRPMKLSRYYLFIDV